MEEELNKEARELITKASIKKVEPSTSEAKIEEGQKSKGIFKGYKVRTR